MLGEWEGNAMPAMRRAILIGMLLCWSSRGPAEFLTGNKLYEFCTSRGIESTVCNSYIMGVVDSYSNNKVCVPKEVAASQVADIVADWLFKHPESRHHSAPELIVEAIQEKFPCN
jgi:Rap1a immunity proteins